MAYINITFPLQDDKETGFLFKRNTTTIEAIKSDLFLLFTTNVGERFYNRGYGTTLMQYIFEQNIQKTEFDIENEIKATVSKYMSNVTVNSISSQQDPNNENTILTFVNFTYTDNAFAFTDTLVIAST